MDAGEPMRLALLGAGMMGGSLALALKEGDAALTITAYDTVAANAQILLARGAVDHVAATAEEAVRDADIVVLATPLGAYGALAAAIAPALKNGVIVTDIGSVKRSMDAVATQLPGARVVPGHPICGSEKSGAAAARADLYRGQLCILTPNAATDSAAGEVIQTLWHAAGADVIQMPAEVHDQIYAYVSHLPHLLAFATASYFHQLGIRIAAEDAVLAQFLRISRSSARMWTDIFLQNREMLLPVLATYIALLEHFATELRAGEKHETLDTASVAKALLPRILAASVISTISLHEQQSGMSLRPFAAGGLRDIVAPAAHTPEGDTEAISHASHAVADHLDAVMNSLRAVESLIGAEDEPALLARLTQMIADAHLLVTPRN